MSDFRWLSLVITLTTLVGVRATHSNIQRIEGPGTPLD
jgi:hypothetical protein